MESALHVVPLGRLDRYYRAMGSSWYSDWTMDVTRPNWSFLPFPGVLADPCMEPGFSFKGLFLPH